MWEESHPAGHPAGHVCQLGHVQPSLGLKMLHARFSPARKSVYVRAGPFVRGHHSCLVYFVTWEQRHCQIPACARRCLVFDGCIQVLVLLNNLFLS